MQNWADPPPSESLTIEQIWANPRHSLQRSRAEALMQLSDYWFRQLEGYPTFGLRELINQLCEEFDVPEELHPFRFEVDREFSINPLTGESYRTDPQTGRVRKRMWKTIWMGGDRTLDLRGKFRAHIRDRIR